MKIKFVPQNIEVELDSDKSVLQVAHENGIPIRSVCKGVPSCAECRVKVVEGENNVLPPTKAELNLVGSTYFVDQRRLSCQLRCFGDVTIDVSDHIGKDENANKKLRGVKHSSLPHQTKAIQGTLVLDDDSHDSADSYDDDISEDSENRGGSTDSKVPNSDSKGESRNRRKRRPRKSGSKNASTQSSSGGSSGGGGRPEGQPSAGNKKSRPRRNRKRRPPKKD